MKQYQGTAFLLTLLLTTTSGCSAQNRHDGFKPLTRFQRTGTTLDGWGWTSQTWAEDNKPYQQLRLSIHQVVVKGRSPGRLLSYWKSRAQANPQDPMAQFGWAYTSWRIATWSPQYQQEYHDFTALPDALAGAPFPNTYDYARMRFLAQASVRPTPQLEDAGERLLKRVPTDLDVKYEMIKVLQQISSLTANGEAVTLAQQLVAAAPKDILYRQTLCSVYLDRYLASGFKKKDRDSTKSAIEDYLKLAPSNDVQRAGMERTLKNLADDEAKTLGSETQ